MSYMQNPHPSLNRTPRSVPFQQTYNTPPIPLSHLSQMSQMSQMSQEHPELRSKYYDVPSMISPNQINSLNFKNNGLGQSVSNFTYGGHASQNLEEVDMGTLISPILLKAYSVLRDCELKPEALDAIEKKLKQRLATLQKYHQNFNQKMVGLVKIAEGQLAKAKNLIGRKTQDKRSTSADQFTKKQRNRTQRSTKNLEERSKSSENLEVPQQPQKKRRSRRRAQKKEDKGIKLMI